MRAPLGQNAVDAPAETGCVPAWPGACWADAEFAAKAAAPATPSAVRTSRRELMVCPFRPVIQSC